MRQLSEQFNEMISVFFISLFLSFLSLNAQTNFVKYAKNPILPLGDSGEWDDSGASFPAILFGDSVYHLWYSGSNQSNSDQREIGYANSSDGLSWDKHTNNPVLGLGTSGEFDDFSVWNPTVLFDGSLYEMWYTGDATGYADWSIGYATAIDPALWTKHAGNPVLTKGNQGEWDQSSVLLPVVIHSDTLYQMWYTGRPLSGIWQTGYATSTDGINWNKHPNNPVLPVGAPGAWDASGALASSVIFKDGQYQMWYQGDINNDFSGIEIGFATSPDGINWTKHPDNPILKPDPGSWDSENVYFLQSIKDGHRYRMWYSGKGANVNRLGYAEDFSNAAHTDSIRSIPYFGPDSNTIAFASYIANPHSENLTIRALITSSDGSVSDSIDLSDAGNGIWTGKWVVPLEANDYTVGVELNNLSAGYIHNSLDWGVFDKYSTNPSTNVESDESVPRRFSLHQNFPNPFNPTTTIKYEVPTAGNVELKIYNQLGQETRKLANSIKPVGMHQVVWDGRNGQGKIVTSGVYFYRLRAGSFVQTRKMLFIR